MTWKLNKGDPSFSEQFDQFLQARRGSQEEIVDIVRTIIQRVREDKDKALIELTQQLDHYKAANKNDLRLSDDEYEQALSSVTDKQQEALSFAASRIRRYHEEQMPQPHRFTDEHGATMGWDFSAVAAAGLYVPGGTAAYPSSVLMNAIPALVAGVEKIIIAAPTPLGVINPLVVAAAAHLGIRDMYRIGGAQAIAALAFGTDIIAKVDVVVGPGNQYVAEAKRQVFGMVGIDMIAGPSEVLILADKTAPASWVAADLLAQAEHDSQAQSILITDSAELASQVITELEQQLQSLPRKTIASESWQQHGAIIMVKSLEDAPALIDAIAPEHLEIMTKNPEETASSIRYAGSFFLGHYAAEAIGDYVAGPNHVLPTSRTARFANPLSVHDFLTRHSTLHLTSSAFKDLADAAITLARCEGLEAHARSLEIRLKS